MLWIDTFFLNIAFLLLGGLAIFEAARALKLNDSAVYVILFWIAHTLNMLFALNLFYFVFVLLFAVFCAVMFFDKKGHSFKQVAAAYCMTFFITFGLRSIVIMRGISTDVPDMRFMLFIALGLGWICDTLAFTFGNLFGKRKLCPAISPGKTIAGAVGGVLGTPIIIVIIFYIYSIKANSTSLFYGQNAPVQLAYYFALGLVGAIVGIIGDLAASFIKRECGIKDYGNVMPGHGGALDRLDSVLCTSVLAAGAFELFFKLFN